MPIAKRLRSEYVVGCPRRRAAPIGRHGQSEAGDGRGRGAGARDSAAERGEDAAVSDCGRLAGVGGSAAPVPLPRPAAAAAAVQHRAAPPRGDGGPALFRRERLLGDRDADPREVDARGRARLPRAEPRAPRRILRAAAVAAALQADPDDRRHGPLLPDRPLLPRRGPARRPSARVHADRRRDVVRAPRDRLRDDRAADARHLQGDRPRGRRCRSGGCRMPRRSRSTARTSPTCASASRSWTCRTSSRTPSSASSSRSSPRAASSAASSCRAAASTRARQLRALDEQAKQLGLAGLIWVRPGEPPTSAVKSLAEATLDAALARAGAGKDDVLLTAAGKADDTSKLLGQLRLAIAKKENLVNPTRSRSRGSPSSRSSSITRKTAAGTRCTTRSRRRSTRTWSKLETDPGRRAREGLRPRR